jgi:hypothetical protein
MMKNTLNKTSNHGEYAMFKKGLVFFIVVLFAGISLFIGCGGYSGDMTPNTRPDIILFPNADSIVVNVAPILSWKGLDRDGEVYYYKWINIPRYQVSEELYLQYFNDPETIGETVPSTIGSIRWTGTPNTQDTIFFSLEYGQMRSEHLFCVKGRDSDSVYSRTECRIFFRMNRPPDTLQILDSIFTDGIYDTLWCLKSTSFSWKGIPINWYGHDPDGSIVLEYYWEVKNRRTGTIARSSLVEDLRGGVYAGEDSTDGWLRNKTNTNLVDCPTGDYWFILKIRDDAFYTSLSDTIEFTLVKPDFDPTDSVIYQSMLDRTFRHSILVVDDNLDFVANPFNTPSDSMIAKNFYTNMFNDLGYSYDMVKVENGVPASPVWNFTKHQLGSHSIMYWFDGEAGNLNKMGAEIVRGLTDYIAVGGSFLLEGRNSFVNVNPSTSGDTSLSYLYFGVVGLTQGTFGGATGITTDRYSYPSLRLNPSVVTAAGYSTNAIRGALALNKIEDNVVGLPSAEIIYLYQDTSLTSEAYNQPAALLYKSSSFRTAVFCFPLYFMDNSTGDVTTAVGQTLEFLTERFPWRVPDSLYQAR